MRYVPAILALTSAIAASSSDRLIVEIKFPPEGRFIVPLDQTDSAWIDTTGKVPGAA